MTGRLTLILAVELLLLSWESGWVWPIIGHDLGFTDLVDRKKGSALFPATDGGMRVNGRVRLLIPRRLLMLGPNQGQSSTYPLKATKLTLESWPNRTNFAQMGSSRRSHEPKPPSTN